jgi:glycerol-3-phosphate dehydrogenase
MKSSLINEKTRKDDIKGLSENELDVLVIGAGITGAGIVLDAASRGLNTGIVDAQDFAAGTSSRSSKLVHGGLRYLMMLDFKLVREALTERDLLLSTIAPHLVKPAPFLYPLLPREWKMPKDKTFVNLVMALGQAIWRRPVMTMGIGMYDVMAKTGKRKKALPMQKHYSKKGLKEIFPDLKDGWATGGIRYYDAKVDDARLVLSVLKTAHTFGALIAPRVQILKLIKSQNNAVTGAIAKDLETGKDFKIKAKKVINATGVWTEKSEKLAEGKGGLKVLSSKGVHLIIPKEKINGQIGIATMTEKSILFVIPWDKYWVIGTTDTPWDKEYKHPVSNAIDVDYILEHVNAVLKKPLKKSDVIGVFAGLRPLLQPELKEGTSSAKVSREHTVASPAKNFVVIAGGKLTTYRVMAKDAVDYALGPLANKWQCITDKLPLIGAKDLSETTAKIPEYAKKYKVDNYFIERLVNRYGSKVTDIFELFDKDPDLKNTIDGGFNYTKAEIVYACQTELALHLEDVMCLRTRLNYETPDSGRKAAPAIAELMGSVLKWDKIRIQKEIDSYKDRITAESVAVKTSNDVDAANARLSAQDIVQTVENF